VRTKVTRGPYILRGFWGSAPYNCEARTSLPRTTAMFLASLPRTTAMEVRQETPERVAQPAPHIRLSVFKTEEVVLERFVKERRCAARLALG
jgi:hypothetical protein